jgi:hypothetical protein
MGFNHDEKCSLKSLFLRKWRLSHNAQMRAVASVHHGNGGVDGLALGTQPLHAALYQIQCV